jgi:sugar phosphate isomerase/epimerase
MMFRVCAITDEIGPSLETALQLLDEWGLEEAEIHTLWDTSIELISEDQFDRLRGLFAQRGFRTAALDSTAFLRCPLRGGPPPAEPIRRFHSIAGSYDEHLALLDGCLRTARRLGAPLIRIFGFWRQGLTSEEVIHEIIDHLRPAVDRAASHGVVLALETCPHTYLAQTRPTLEVIRRIDSPWLRLLWDPSNAFRSGDTDVVGLAGEAAPYLAHLHVKGIQLEEGFPDGHRYVPLDQGQVDYSTLLRRLAEAGYSGFVSLEPHYALPSSGLEGAARETFRSLEGILAGLDPPQGILRRHRAGEGN